MIYDQITVSATTLSSLRATHIVERDSYHAAVQRLLRAGTEYVQDTGHRAPAWLGTMHHQVLRQMVYREGQIQGAVSLLGMMLGEGWEE